MNMQGRQGPGGYFSQFLFFSAPTVLPQGGSSPLREGQTTPPRGCFFLPRRPLRPSSPYAPAAFLPVCPGGSPPRMATPEGGYAEWGPYPGEVKPVSYVNPAIRPQFDAMPPALRERVLAMDVRLERVSDLVCCLERIAARASARD